jgi:GDPmannose 4,6-dehydratase
MKKRALITGITGMDGSHLADYLLELDYEVYGLVRRHSKTNNDNIADIKDNIKLIPGDMCDQNSLFRALKESDPDEVYNLAAQSFVKESWATPEQTTDITGMGVLRMLEAIRMYGKEIKFYQASSSEMFGKMTTDYADENSRFHPRSPYGVAKVYGHWITVNYRESYGMFNCSGILFNHESHRRGKEFVTRKITDSVARIKYGLQDKIQLGNLDAVRDWGHARDYVKAMHLMLQQDKPDDFVIATGETHTVRDFLDHAFKYIGIDDWSPYVETTQDNLRPADVEYLRGDSSKAKKILKWEPEIPFKKLVDNMMLHDMVRVSQEVSRDD